MVKQMLLVLIILIMEDLT